MVPLNVADLDAWWQAVSGKQLENIIVVLCEHQP